MNKNVWLLCKNFVYTIVLVLFLTIIASCFFNNIVRSSLAKKIKNNKYDVIVENIQYYELAIKYRYVFPPSLGENIIVKDFHFYSYKDEKFEIILYIEYNQEEFIEELSRLDKDKLEYNYSTIEKGDYIFYIFKRDSISLLFEYVTIDKINRRMFYVYSYGVKNSDSTIIGKYRL